MLLRGIAVALEIGVTAAMLEANALGGALVLALIGGLWVHRRYIVDAREPAAPTVKPSRSMREQASRVRTLAILSIAGIAFAAWFVATDVDWSLLGETRAPNRAIAYPTRGTGTREEQIAQPACRAAEGLGMKHDDQDGVRSGRGRDGDHEHGSTGGAGGGMAPGKRTLTQGLGASDPTSTMLRGLDAAEARLAAVAATHLPSMRAAIEARDIIEARAASAALASALAKIDADLAAARRFATLKESDGAASLIAPLEARRDALRAEAAPVLALAPPPAPALPVAAAFDFATMVDTAPAYDAAEDANRAQWGHDLDAAESPRDNVIDAADRFAVQRRAAGAAKDPALVKQRAATGVAGTGVALPHLDVIQASFGAHDVTGVRAHVGGAAADASAAIGAEAYATGNHVAFASSPSLFVAAHEAAHIVQQRAGVSLLGGVGVAGDPYEQHADAVAERVVRGESAEGLLGAIRERTASTQDVQTKESPEHAFLMLQLDAIAAAAASAVARIETLHGAGESPTATDAHVEITSTDAIGAIFDRLNNLRGLAPANADQKLARGAKTAASSLVALFAEAERAGVDIAVERDAAEIVFAAFGVDLATVKAAAGHARFSSKERARSITAAIDGAIDRLQHAHKRVPTADIDAANALILQAEADLREGRAKGTKRRVQKLSGVLIEYLGWAEGKSLPDEARTALSVLEGSLSSLRSRVGLGEISATTPATRPRGAADHADVDDGRTTDPSKRAHDPAMQDELDKVTQGFVWLNEAAQRRLEVLRVALKKEDEPSWSEQLLKSVLDIGLSAGAAAIGIAIANKLVSNGEVRKELGKMLFEGGLVAGVTAGRAKIAAGSEAEVIDTFLDSQKEGVEATHFENQRRFIDERSTISTLEEAERLSAACSRENVVAAAEEQYEATRDAWVSYLAQSKFGAIGKNGAVQEDDVNVGPTTTNMKSEQQRRKTNRSAPGFVPEEAPSVEAALFGGAPGVLAVVAKLPEIEDGVMAGRPRVTTALLNGVNSTIRKEYEGTRLVDMRIPRTVAAEADSAPDFVLNVDEAGQTNYLDADRRAWLAARATVGHPENEDLGGFARAEAGAQLLLEDLVPSSIKETP